MACKYCLMERCPTCEEVSEIIREHSDVCDSLARYAENVACGWAFDAGMREAEQASMRAFFYSTIDQMREREAGLLERLKKRDEERAKHRADLGKAQQRLYEARKDEMKAREEKDAAVAAERARWEAENTEIREALKQALQFWRWTVPSPQHEPKWVAVATRVESEILGAPAPRE